MPDGRRDVTRNGRPGDDYSLFVTKRGANGGGGGGTGTEHTADDTCTHRRAPIAITVSVYGRRMPTYGGSVRRVERFFRSRALVLDYTRRV